MVKDYKKKIKKNVKNFHRLLRNTLLLYVRIKIIKTYEKKYKKRLNFLVVTLLY